MSRANSQSAAVPLADARRALRDLIDGYPATFMHLSRIARPHLVTSLTPHVDLIIEGFPRSGNTFTHHALKVTQPTDLLVGHHFHASSNVIEAVRRQIPVVVLIRRPVDAVTSYVVKAPKISVSRSLRSWITYYRRLLPFRSDILFVDFDLVTSDFPTIVEAISNRFALQLLVPASHDDTQHRAFLSIADRRRETHGDNLPQGFITNMPDEMRSHQKENAMARFWNAALEPARVEANALYDYLSNR